MNLYTWWFGPSLRVYPAIPMTGRTGQQIWRQYREQRKTARKYRITVVSPVPGEGIRVNNAHLKNKHGVSATYIWAKDRIQIKNQHGFIFPRNGKGSIGCITELVKARGTHWKITAIILPKSSFIAENHYDVVAKTQEQAYRKLAEGFLSRHQRAVYRLKFIWKIPRHIYWLLREFWL